MTTVVLILLCLAIAGRELYLAFDRKRAGGPVTDIDGLRDDLRDDLHDKLRVDLEARDEVLTAADARIRSLISQINDRMLPEINERLAGQHESADRLIAEVATLRRQLLRRLDQAVAASLGQEPLDTVAGVLGGEVGAAARGTLTQAYERCAAAYGLGVELTDERTGEGAGGVWRLRYYLSGPSPRELERDFIGMLRALRQPASDGAGPKPTAAQRNWVSAVQPLLKELREVDYGVAQFGPLLLVRTPEALVCGVQPLAELLRSDPSALPADPVALSIRLHGLPESRFCDLSAWRPQALSA